MCSRICKQYEDIKETVRSIPENTEELVTLDQFIERTYKETVHDLIEEIAEAVHRLSFLLDHANLPGIKHLRFFSVWFLSRVRGDAQGFSLSRPLSPPLVAPSSGRPAAELPGVSVARADPGGAGEQQAAPGRHEGEV